MTLVCYCEREVAPMFHTMVASSVLVFGLVLAPAVAQPANGLAAGAAKLTITPKGDAWIAGYEPNRRSDGTIGDLYAACIAVRASANDKPVAVVALDLIGLSNAVVNRIRALVPELPPENLLVVCTHTHSGPDTIGLWGPPGKSGVDPEYMTFLTSRVADCVHQALSAMKPASLKFASGVEVTGVSRNDRVPAILDTELCAMQAIDSDGKPIGTLINFACHPEIFHGHKMTADFPMWLRNRVEQKAGGVAVYVNGALGGMVTADVHDAEDEAAWRREAERIGTTIADAALDALEKARPVASAPVTVNRAVVRIPLGNERFQQAADAGVLPSETLSKEGVVTEVTHLSIGPAEFVGIPGEALPDVGFLMKRLMKGSPKFVVGLCNDELGYILSEENYGLKLYQYETSMSVGPQAEPLIKEALRPMIAAFKPTPTLDGAPPDLSTWAPADIFRVMPGSFRPEKAKGLTATILWHITGQGGGYWTMRIADQKLTIAPGEDPNPDTTIEMSAADFAAMASGKLDGMQAAMTGRLKVSGDLTRAMLLGTLFGPTPKE